MCWTGLDVLIDCVFPVREGNEKSYQLLRDSLDLYLTINPDNVQYLLLQARLYFHLGIWPEKVGMRTNLFGVKLTPDSVPQNFGASLSRSCFVLGPQVLDILQHIQALDPSQHGAVGYLVQHTLEHIQHKKHPATPEEKRRSAPEHLEVQYAVGLIMKHKRCVCLFWPVVLNSLEQCFNALGAAFFCRTFSSGLNILLAAHFLLIDGSTLFL